MLVVPYTLHYWTVTKDSCDTSMLLVSQQRVTRRKVMLLRQRRVCPQIIAYEQSSPVGLLAQDSRGRPLNSVGFKKMAAGAGAQGAPASAAEATAAAAEPCTVPRA